MPGLICFLRFDAILTSQPKRLFPASEAAVPNQPTKMLSKACLTSGTT